MKKLKFTIFIFVFLIGFILSGCSSEVDCSEQDTTYEKFSWNEELDKCVSRKIERDVCGNGVIEDGENYCNCPDDVSKTHPEAGCSGQLGEYLEKSCNDKNECMLKQSNKVVEEVKSVEFGNSDLTIKGTVKYNNPYIFNVEDKNLLQIDLSLFKFSGSKNVKNLIVKEIKVEGSNSKVLGSAKYNEDLMNIDDKLSTKKIELSQTSEYDAKQYIKLILDVSYTVENLNYKDEISSVDDEIESMSETLGRVQMINPTFYEED